MLQARKAGARLVCIDPFKCRTAERSDWWLPVRPGTDAALALGVVIGFYGALAEKGRANMPAPASVADRFGSPVLGLFGGADQSIPPELVSSFDEALERAGVDHVLITYPGAPHSFFDRKASEFADESAAAWEEVLTFLRERGAQIGA